MHVGGKKWSEIEMVLLECERVSDAGVKELGWIVLSLKSVCAQLAQSIPIILIHSTRIAINFVLFGVRNLINFSIVIRECSSTQYRVSLQWAWLHSERAMVKENLRTKTEASKQ